MSERHSNENGQTTETPSLIDRLKTRLVTDYLPRIGLTSYKTLERHQAFIEELIGELKASRAETAQLADTLKQQRIRENELTGQLAEVRAENDRLAADVERLTRHLASVEIKNDRLAAELKQATRELVSMKDERARLVDELAQITGRHELRGAAKGGKDPVRVVSIEHPADLITEINRRLCDVAALHQMREFFREHYLDEDDENLSQLWLLYREALYRGLPYWDLRVAARVMSSVLKPETYLEVGARRGWSLAQVMAATPEVQAYVFDMWVEDYAEAKQGSPEYIRAKMKEVLGPDHEPKIEFISGNSHDTLPEFFDGSIDLQSGPPPQVFDLITVDGDHAPVGAWWDLYDLFPRVKVGGAILFDDLDMSGEALAQQDLSFSQTKYERPPLPVEVESLMDLWLYMQTRYPNFVYFTNMSLSQQTGIALRLK
jgi:hypothetical protein